MGGWTRRRRLSMVLITLSGEPRLVLNVQITNVCVYLCLFVFLSSCNIFLSGCGCNQHGRWVGGGLQCRRRLGELKMMIMVLVMIVIRMVMIIIRLVMIRIRMVMIRITVVMIRIRMVIIVARGDAHWVRKVAAAKF